MKKLLLLNNLLVLLLLTSISAMGQYTGGNPDVAASKPATAMDSIAGFEPSKAVDGLPDTYCSLAGDAPVWLQVDLGSFHYIDGYGLILPDENELPLTYTIQGSVNGSYFTNIKDGSISTADDVYENLTWPGDYRYVRINITEKDDLASITEFYVYGEETVTPTAPYNKPATNVTGSGFTASWTSRENATGYIVSVATDIGFDNYVPGYQNLDVGNVLSLDVTGLSPSTTYYQHVKAYNIVGTSSISNIISVTTTKETQTITFDSLPAVTYGDPDFSLTATASSGLTVSYVSSEVTVATVTDGTVTIVGPGTTSIIAMQDGDDEYEAADPVVQDLLVNIKPLTVMGATAADKVYDGMDEAVLSGGTLEGIVGADDVSLADATSGTFAQTDVGTGIVVATAMTLSGTDAAKYSITQPVVTGAITPKDLTVTPDDMSREACTSNPEFTLGYEGFVGDEDESVLVSAPVASTTADENSAPGTYDITASGGDGGNYNLVYATGVLTVTADVTDPVLSVQDITIQLDESGNASITPADVVVSAEDGCEVVDTTLSQSAFTSTDVGDVVIDVTVTDAAGNSATESCVVTVEDPTGLVELFESGVNIYPNPTSGKVEMELRTPVKKLKVMDMSGKIVMTRSDLKTRETIDLYGYSNGIYIFQLQVGEALVHIKVIKE